MSALIQPLVGLGLVALGAIFWTSSRQLKRVYPRLKTELFQVPVKAGHLSPRASRATSGLLRSGPVMDRNQEVVTEYVLSDDAIRTSR